ncbi:unnamed protein product [Anisakis simplex]|uniref:Serine/threonine-protein kinase WNK1 n=1 Tax=Anisakis simplex TaxID=6269 RepID=A0A0M3KAY2_ANISI|nr:unnamed protein product [Anisakis simplex]
MQAMSGMGGFAGCGFPPLTPTSSFYSPVVSQPPPVSVPSPMVGGGLSQPSLTSQGQAPGPAQAHVQTHQSHLHHPQQTTSAATAAAASGTAQIPHSQSQLCPPLSLPQSMIPSTSSVVLNPLAGSTQHQLLHTGGSAILQGAGPGSVPVTAPLTHQIKNEMTCSSASDESKESSYDMYANESNNDTEAVHRMSRKSPRTICTQTRATTTQKRAHQHDRMRVHEVKTRLFCRQRRFKGLLFVL